MTSIDRLAAQDAARSYTQNTDATRAAAAHQAGKGHHRQHPQTAKSVDSVSLSDSARALAAARDAVKNAPDVRDQRITELSQKINDGTYSVPANVLARKMLGATNTQT
jgi:flagellar biosynthesis anti-sigma factor FlgM